jgi:hypothetical protein
MLPMKMPWKGRSVPHGTLDIIRQCNIECQGCYNAHPGFTKSFDEVKHDLNDLMSHRKLDIVTLAGGEVTLHPDLPDIVRHVKTKGLGAAIITNGVLLDEARVRQLRDCGIDLILLHIQRDQRRSDLPADASLDDVERLRAEKLSLVGENEIETGICHIIYRNRMDECQRVLAQFCESRWARFALMTLFSDFGKLGTLEGNLDTGFRQVSPGKASQTELEPEAKEVIRIFSDFGLDPFAYVGASDGSEGERWLIYFLLSVFKKSGDTSHHGMSSSLLERAVMQLGKVIPAGSRFMLTPSRAALLTHLLLNAIAGGRFRENLSFMSKALAKDTSCHDKHILLQRAPECTEDGAVVFCDGCPDATIRNGELLPHCLVDRIDHPQARTSPEERCAS